MNKKALCIGINDYPGTDMDLFGCANDARDWGAELARRGFAVHSLIDAQATRAALTAAMQGLIDEAVAGDLLVITYAGHGSYQPDDEGDEADGLDEALCPYDLLSEGALCDDEIRQIFSTRKRGVRLVMISDSCHSGTVTRAAADAEDVQGARARFLPMGNWLPAARLPRNRSGAIAASVARAPQGAAVLKAAMGRHLGDLLLAGCEEGPNNFSYDATIAGRPNGAFSYFALKALKTLAPGASYAQWHAAIRRYLPCASYAQIPQLVGSPSARRQVVFE